MSAVEAAPIATSSVIVGVVGSGVDCSGAGCVEVGGADCCVVAGIEDSGKEAGIFKVTGSRTTSWLNGTEHLLLGA